MIHAIRLGYGLITECGKKFNVINWKDNIGHAGEINCKKCLKIIKLINKYHS